MHSKLRLMYRFCTLVHGFFLYLSLYSYCSSKYCYSRSSSLLKAIVETKNYRHPPVLPAPLQGGVKKSQGGGKKISARYLPPPDQNAETAPGESNQE